jgi:hypothetical protein
MEKVKVTKVQVSFLKRASNSSFMAFHHVKSSSFILKESIKLLVHGFSPCNMLCGLGKGSMFKIIIGGRGSEGLRCRVLKSTIIKSFWFKNFIL